MQSYLEVKLTPAKNGGESGGVGGEARISGALLLKEDGLVFSESETFNGLGTMHPQKPSRQMGRGLESPRERSQSKKQILEKFFLHSCCRTTQAYTWPLINTYEVTD